MIHGLSVSVSFKGKPTSGLSIYDKFLSTNLLSNQDAFFVVFHLFFNASPCHCNYIKLQVLYKQLHLKINS